MYFLFSILENKSKTEQCSDIIEQKMGNNLKTQGSTGRRRQMSTPDNQQFLLPGLQHKKMKQGQTTVCSDAHIQLLPYVHLRVMKFREATLKSTDKSIRLK